MPNHIKNRIVIIGSDDRVKELIERYSTAHEGHPNKSYDGNLIYIKRDSGYEVGWLNEETNEFTRRDMPTVIGVPEGYKLDVTEPWVAMPDFNKIIPQPEGMDISIHSGIESSIKKFLGLSYWGTPSDRSDLNEEEQKLFDQGVKNYREHGHIYWYSWAIANWGTKWGGYSYEKVNDNTFTFETAWSGVPNMIHAMSQEFPDLKIEYLWSDEDTGSNCGKIEFADGEYIETDIENGSVEAYEIAFELKPEDRSYYNLVDGEYVYHDEDEDEEEDDE